MRKKDVKTWQMPSDLKKLTHLHDMIKRGVFLWIKAFSHIPQ